VTAEPVERKLAAILSADVVGYSRLMAEDDAATIRTLTDYREAIAMLVRQHRGRVVDSPGDNVLAEFPSALEAVRGAVEIQRVIQARNADLPAKRRMEFRIGVHLGDVTVEGDRIYGDGVNIAARLEGLAEPAGVCISGTVYEQVEKKLNVELEDLGEKPLKNIARPVHVYGVKLLLAEPEREGVETALPGMEELTVPGFGDRPAIAVLPFDNLSGDPEQEYFADGIAEDLITRLSAWRGFPVIARNSSFVYKGKSVDVKQVSRELGVRYVVEGSVRRAAGRVRISAQLIDATSGHHVWAERYDRELEDIFSLQDEITEAIVASMYPTLGQFEWERAARREPESLDAWEYLARGWWHLNQFTKDGNREAHRLFERAIELDPHLASAFSALAWMHYSDIVAGWTDAPDRSMGEMFRTAERSVALDDKDPMGHLALAGAYSLIGQRQEIISALELALQLNSSFPWAYYWRGVLLGGGLADVERAIRLSPQDPWMWIYLEGVGIVHFLAGRYEDAVEWAQRSLQRRPGYLYGHLLIAISYAHLGRIDEARAALQKALTVEPDFSLAAAEVMLSVWDPADLERYLDGLRKAGLKE
jgi:adenylate cyclase